MGYGFRRAGQAILVAGLYYLAFRFSWFHSADQFYLPAGLRIATLLFLPYRLWPSIFLGDAAGMLSLRLPFAESHYIPASWAFASSFLLCPILSLGPLSLRKLFPAMMQKREKWLPISLAGLALWGVLANIALNAMLGGPLEPNLASYFYKVSTGQYLTSLVAVMPILLWLRRSEIRLPKKLLRDSAIGVTLLLGAYFSAGHVGQTWQRLALLGLMIVPALGLTVLHGWRGAAVGVVVANIALGFSIPTTGIAGNKDMEVFVAQQTLAVMGTFLLFVGSTISREFERSHRLVNATQESRLLARANHLSTEQALRDRAEAIAAAQRRLNVAFRETVARLKDEGHYALAMHINAQSLASTRLVYQEAIDLYPFQLERSGLFAALQAPEFASKLSGAKATFSLTGTLHDHDLTLQLVAYRCICHAIEMAPADEYHVRVKAGFSERGWIAATVIAGPRNRAIRTESSRMAEVQLDAKMEAYSGRYRSNGGRLTFWLADDHGLRRGTTIQDGLEPLTNLTTKSSES